ncbi:Carbohydrate binding module (family 35) [Nonomuraea maritima]|uniref:Carbohydrate binding module (Family 35) n=1 Tax=Nonomuraea maritima TaxID=683260 RepID=A0A1G9CIK6_9ACTN|nr:LamG-like jellyroll fold domain-containing protein [Nonomuraea maritima]SDK51487.1 Carbohydrate binding module (family 35) [Nonomuraea maritima]
MAFPSITRALAGILPAALALSLTTGVAAAAAAPEPVLTYDFDADDLTTGTITDTSGNGLDGELVNAATAALVDGAAGGHALSLPGGASTSDGAYVRLPAAALKGRTDLTVSTRVRWDGTTAPWQWIYALGKDNVRYLFSTPYNGDGRLRTAVTTSGGGAEAQVTGYAPLPANAWKTLTVTLDTTARRVTTYLDGAAVSSAPTTITAAQLIDDAATSAGFIGRSFYPDPLFDGAIDDFRVYAAALTAEQVAELAGGTPATPTGLSRDTYDVRTTVGTAPTLPPAVRATFSDGYDRDVPVTWSSVDPDSYAAAGTFTVTGSAAGRPVTAEVTVVREGRLVIDLAKDTGAFHGGASGTLYGLYGPGVPTNNLIEGMNLRTVSTKAQDGPQHPGADALEVVKPLADSTDGDVYIYMTDIHRGFPYQWPGSTPEEKFDLYRQKIAKQVAQVGQLDPKYQDNIVFVPFNEPEGNMFGTGQWSYNGVSWLNDPRDYFRAWDEVYALIKGALPDARIAGPNTSVLYSQVKGFLEHTVEAGTVPDVMTWHELSHPEQVRSSVKRYREMEAEVFAGTSHAGRKLPININEYAFNYHTSVPGQMIQWVSAIEESKVDADIAYWNIDGNLSDSAVQANRGNGQWWLLNAYGQMSGHTVEVTPPFPGQNYTLQGVATLDPAKKQARALIGGASSAGHIRFENVPEDVLGRTLHAWVREIPWTGQIGDSSQPELIAERDVTVENGAVVLNFGEGDLPRLEESSAYEIVLSPAGTGTATAQPPKLWERSYEAEDAAYTGGGYSRNGPEGSPSDVSKFYTSGGYDVGGLRTGSDVVLDFTVDVPQAGRYDLSVFANSLNTFDRVAEQGPTNVFVRVDGGAEQEMFLPLGYKWVVWDHADTTVELTAGRHVISLAARSLDGSKATRGDAIVDRIHLSLPNPAGATSVYEGELATLHGAGTAYDVKGAGVSGSGAAAVARGKSATFWVYSAEDAAAVLDLKLFGPGQAKMAVNGVEVLGHARRGAATATVSLAGGVNKVTVTGKAATTLVDRLEVRPAPDALPATVYEAESARLTGTAQVSPLSLAGGQAAVTGIGGEPGNDNTLTFTVRADAAGTYAMRVRYSNPEQSPATHYNPDPLARRADIAVNGAAPQRVLFPHTFHENNFWELTVPVKLKKGANTVRFSSEETPNFDGTTYASETFPGVLLRSQYAPVIDSVTVAPYSR